MNDSKVPKAVARLKRHFVLDRSQTLLFVIGGTSVSRSVGGNCVAVY
jgi:hypothetical protein